MAIRNDKTEAQIKPIARFRITPQFTSSRNPAEARCKPSALRRAPWETFRASTRLRWRYSATDARFDNCPVRNLLRSILPYLRQPTDPHKAAARGSATKRRASPSESRHTCHSRLLDIQRYVFLRSSEEGHMCPACVASTAVMFAGAGSTGGILAVCIGRFRKFFRGYRQGLFQKAKEN